MAERPNALALKASVALNPPGVQIPPLPPRVPHLLMQVGDFFVGFWVVRIPPWPHFGHTWSRYCLIRGVSNGVEIVVEQVTVGIQGHRRRGMSKRRCSPSLSIA